MTEGAYSTLQSSDTLPDLRIIDKYSGSAGSDFSGSNSINPSLPGLSALASVASAPTSNLRYVQNNLGPCWYISGNHASSLHVPPAIFFDTFHEWPVLSPLLYPQEMRQDILTDLVQRLDQ